MLLLWLAVAWFAGIGLAAVLDLPWWPPLVLAAMVGAGLGKVPQRLQRARWSTACGLVLLLGFARAAWAERGLPPDHVVAWNDQGDLALRGRIGAEPAGRDRGVDYRLDVEAVRGAAAARARDAWRPAVGRVLVQGPRYPRHEYGATVVVTGTLVTPPQLEGFDYRAYLARQGIHGLVRRPRMATLATGGGNPLRRWLLAVKDRARASLAASLPEPEASLATGILLGDDDRIPRRVADAFQTTNTTHVIAISGSNIALLVTLLRLTLGRWLGRRRAFPAILAVLGLYTALVGADAAVSRAAVMGGIMLLGLHLGRPGHAATALCAAGWAMTVYRPAYLWDLGFQLSFAATAGLIAFASRFATATETRLAAATGEDRAQAAMRLLNEAVLVTMAAQLTTWPLIAFHTGQVSLVGLAANFLILPAQPPIMGLGALAAAAGIASPAAGQVVGTLAWLPLAWTVRVVETMARLPMATVTWPMGLVPLAGYYGVLLLVLLRRTVLETAGSLGSRLRTGVASVRGKHAAESGDAVGAGGPAGVAGPATRRRLSRWRRGGNGWLHVGLAGMACALAWVGALSRPDGRLHVYALDVGQGDAILVVTPNGRRMLVDGGPGPSAVLDQLGRRLAPWDRRLDVVLLTHPDADHVAGLPAVLERFHVDHVVDPELDANGPDAQAWRAGKAARADKGARIHRAVAGGRIVLDEAAGVTADILWPPDTRFTLTERPANDNSVVLRLTYGKVSFLLTGDIEAPAEAALLATGVDLRATVLKVGHHGSTTSSSPAFLAGVRPWAALISVGADNRFGHPAAETLAALAPLPVWRTDRQGTVEVVTDGAAVWVR